MRVAEEVEADADEEDHRALIRTRVSRAAVVAVLRNPPAAVAVAVDSAAGLEVVAATPSR